MNHLKRAKELLDGAKYKGANQQVYWGIEQVDVASAYAFIAIAEQLEKMNKTPEQKHYDSLSNTCHCPGCGAVVENPGNWCDDCVPF